jgi:hypothetical protein
MQNYIELPWGPVYEYNMTSPNQILSTKFYRVVMNEDRNEKWHFKKGIVSVRASVPISQPTGKIPNHILRVYLQDAITRNEICPVTMEPLTMNAGVTSCGHLFNKDAVLMAVRQLGSCPTCRAAVRVEDIQSL